jgi:hypothetical protein
MRVFQYLGILICAFIGLYFGVLILPKYDDIIYPFGPNFSLYIQFYEVLFPLGFLSMLTALLASWVYKTSMSFAAFSSVAAITIDYKFNLFTNLAEHYFHFSFVLVYVLGVYVCYWIIKRLLARFSAKNT